MTTYTVTMTNKLINFTFTWRNQTAAQVKELKASYKNTKGAKVTATKEIKCYYRGTVVIVHEERQNNRSLISSLDGTYKCNSVMTHELEYR